ncbi:hypothetical protein O181_058722 [Austropuccinia psidii MF-1]|uniref:Transmembrane protein 135 N-terminal domain-containing protein n=1 Tax=Austropuccinia psidii MF-1 TaxID=1389203 RepID=A0A9Q3EF96_9BASI|nr:hypothetical protein [Austropuccinia psidii MF-1]
MSSFNSSSNGILSISQDSSDHQLPSSSRARITESSSNDSNPKTKSSARSFINLILPSQRTSFITDANEFSRKKDILFIAIKKGLFVFSSVHGVVSSTLVALALVRGNLKIKNSKSRNLFNTTKHFIKFIVATFRSPSTTRLASWLGLYSTLWTISYSFLKKQKTKCSHWNAFLAGSFSGISLLAQTKSSRKEIAPNVFCRGLYSILLCYPLIRFKYWDVLLFALSSAQIAIGYLLYPSTLPKWYSHWISRVGGLNPRFVKLNRELDQSLISSNAHLINAHRHILSHDAYPLTHHNQLRVQKWLNHPNCHVRKGAPCALNHPNHSSCLAFNFYTILRISGVMGPTYAVLHLVPALIFRSKVLLKSPILFIASIIKKTIASALFIGTFASIVENCFCLPSQLYERWGVVIRGEKLYGSLGFLTGLALLWEQPKRRGELALYCAPKALSSLWSVLKAKKLVQNFIGGDVLIGSIGSGMLMHCFIHHKDKMPALARGTISQLVDPHTPERRKQKSDDN